MSTALFAGDRDSNDHVAAFIAHAGTCFAWFLAPLVVYLVLPRSSRWARYQALQSLLWSLVGTLVSIATCGLLTSVEKRGEVSAPAARRSRTTSALARVTSSSSSLSLSG